MAAPEGTAKFREETSCNSGEPLAAMHNMFFVDAEGKRQIQSSFGREVTLTCGYRIPYDSN